MSPGVADVRKHWHNAQAVLGARWQLREAESLGPRVRLWGRAAVTIDGRLLIGDRVRLMSTVVPLELRVGAGALLEIGERTFINYGCSIGATLSIRIGANSSIGTYCTLIDNDFHCIEPERRQEQPPSAPIVLEENVWLGTRVVVLRGVRIGQGSVIGAGSVVAKDIPPRTVAAGVPAKVIKTL
ncbi:MAG TPA: acyltransferase [Polyangiaceae bacterium]